MLKWEVATRIRWGMVAAMPDSSFKLVLRKASSLTPNTRSRRSLLEYNQAMQDYKGGFFTLEEKAEGKTRRAGCSRRRARSGTWRRAQPSRTPSTSGSPRLRPQRRRVSHGRGARELQRMLDVITDMEPADIEAEALYLPAHWFADGEVPVSCSNGARRSASASTSFCRGDPRLGR